ncbi:MAG: hypothetical protein ABIE25_03160 [Thermoplasmatota archaeon]|nr:hypothetical protein [Candidatus Thermoplasmatota archaeon]MBU1914950.1 hypothetical protein [Candidatus Thermoplasmatota archaeon]
MSEGTNSSAPASEPEQPRAVPASTDKGKKNLWLMIAAIVVVILLISSMAYVFVLMPKDELEAVISPDPFNVDAGALKALSVEVTWKGNVLAANNPDLDFIWSVDPTTMGSFDRRAVASVNFTAAIVGGDGTISCKVTYKETTEVTAEAVLTVNPPILDSVVIDPSTKTLAANEGFVFNATAVSSVAVPIIQGVTFNWSVTGLTASQYTLNATTGSSVNFTGLVEGQAVLTAQTTYNGVTKSGSANITVGTIPTRSVDYRYYGFFEVPFGEWWDLRWSVSHDHQIISYTYPTIFYWYTQPPGNVWIYSNDMLDVKGRNMSEINMNSNPEFLPLLGTARGGNAELDWYMQYLTKAEMKRYPAATSDWEDGWVISLNGTTTMDKQAAMAVLNVTSAGFDDFTTWWTEHATDVKGAYTAWLMKEGNKRLDIYNMYEYPLVPLTFDLSAEKVADKIVLSYDIVSWGMDAMISRWLHEAFTPTEHWFEDFNMHAKIGPERADIDINTVVAYGIYAYETTVVPAGKTHGDPCWTFELYLQDVLKPTIGHPHSDYAPYVPYDYMNTAPGSKWYGKEMPYDYAPGPHNISENETLRIEYPTGPQLFKEQAYQLDGWPNVNETDINKRIVNTTANMTFNYAEPMVSDNTELSPGSLTVDNVAGLLTYTGPIDMWTWSKDQTKHQWLADEWDRLGIIPYGIPYVEFTWEQPPAAPQADRYEVSAMSSPVIAGEPVTFTVTVYDQYNNVFPSYVGTLNFTSTDLAAVLPGNYTFTTTAAGIHVFDNLTFGTAGLQDLMLVDADNSSLTGEALDIDVRAAAAADHFGLSDIPNVVEINVAQDVTVTVYDQYDRLFVGYAGTITFGSNRSAEVALPSDTTVPAGESHVTIPGSVTFTSIGWFLVNASDTIDGTIDGETTVQVELEAPHIDHFVVTGETELAPGQYYDLTVRAVNQFGSTFQTYAGTVHFATDAPGGTYSLPADTLFALSNNGVKVFTGAMRFSQMGTYEVNVSDTITTTAYGLLSSINVAARPNIVYTAYDFFEEPWGEWYWNPDWRPSWYYQDYMLSNTSGQYVQLYDPGQDGAHGVLFAPYRFNMTATNVSNVDVHNPEFMPVLGGVGPQAGAEASMHIRMQYLDHAWWTSYWYPTWGGGSPVLRNYINTNDGYLIGTLITVELNREAAYEWMGMPIADDPVAWWDTNRYTYEDAWTAWVDDEGNNRLDIFAGYADFYYPQYTWANASVDTDGDILLTVAHVNWGYEVLMTRWLTESQLCAQHQPYMEDFDMRATYGNGIANVTFDAVAQYSFHAAMANGSTSQEGAWVWEPTRIDYWPSWTEFPAYHPSDFDPYAGPSWLGTTTYQSWNSGDPKFGQEVEYDATPQWFNLTEFQTLIVKLPQGSNVIAYRGQGVGANAIFNLSTGDTTEYDALRYTGTASLGYVITNPANPLDMASVYDPLTKTLTFTGPYDFNNQGGRTGILYHGAPWIEFIVTPPLKTESVPEPTPEVTAETAPAVTAEMLSLVAAICGVLIAVPALVGTRRWDE